MLADTYRGPWVHDRVRVFTDLAAAVADGADCVSGIGDRWSISGPMSTVRWRR